MLDDTPGVDRSFIVIFLGASPAWAPSHSRPILLICRKVEECYERVESIDLWHTTFYLYDGKGVRGLATFDGRGLIGCEPVWGTFRLR
jgi:hypothetical protein